MNEMTRLVQNHDYLTPRIAGKSGISKFKFYKYVRENGLEPVSRGVYSTGADWVDELYVLHKRCPNAVFSHDEAFYYHGLTDREPFVHTLTIYSGYNAHRLTADGSCKVYTVKRELLDVGKIIVKDNDGKRFKTDYYHATPKQREFIDAVATHEYQLMKAHEKGLSRASVPPFMGMKRSERSNNMPA